MGRKWNIKKILLIILIIAVIVITGCGVTTPEFHGKILDATTGEPIEKAVVSAVWLGHKFMQIEGGVNPFHSITVITGKDGEYVIPKYKDIYILSSFTHEAIEVTHPLYEKANPGYIWENAYTGKENYKGTRLPNGTIQYDIKLVGIEEAMRRGVQKYERTKDLRSLFNYGSYIGTYSGSFFKDHWDRKFVEDVLKKWEEIMIKNGEKYNYDYKKLSSYDELNRVKKQVEEAYKGEK